MAERLKRTRARFVSIMSEHSALVPVDTGIVHERAGRSPGEYHVTVEVVGVDGVEETMVIGFSVARSFSSKLEGCRGRVSHRTSTTCEYLVCSSTDNWIRTWTVRRSRPLVASSEPARVRLGRVRRPANQ